MIYLYQDMYYTMSYLYQDMYQIMSYSYQDILYIMSYLYQDMYHTKSMNGFCDKAGMVTLTKEIIGNSMAPRGCECNVKLVIFKLISRTVILSISSEITVRWMPQVLNYD